MECKYVILLYTLLPCFIYSKSLNKETDYSYQVLINKIDLYYDQPTNALPYINLYINKAKNESNSRHLFYAYKEAIYANETKELKLIYSDSLVYISKNMKESDWRVQAFLSKGLVYYQYKDLKRALKEYKFAYNSKDKYTDTFLLAKLNLNTAIILIHLSQYKEAEIILKNNLEYYKQNLDHDNFKTYYLNTLFYLGKLNQKNRNYRLAEEYNTKGFEFSNDINDLIFKDYFTFARSIDDYYIKNYNSILNNFFELEDSFNKKSDFNSLASLYYYAGKSNYHLNKLVEAFNLFNKVDSIFNLHPFIDIDYRNVFHTLYENELNHGVKEKQIYYVNQLIKYDQYNHDLVSLLPYEASNIIVSDKEVSIKNKSFLIIGSISIISCLIFIAYSFRIKFNKYSMKKKSTMNVVEKSDVGLNKDIVDQILKKLKVFEENHKYTDPNISLNNLAIEFNTNALYLSKIINNYKNTNFNTYINSLRINYIITLLNHDHKYFNYSLKGLALEVGFKSSRHFSEQFLKFTGEKPLKYINNLKLTRYKNANNSN